MSGCSTKLGCKPGIFVVFSVVFSTCFLGTTPRVKHPIGNENPKWHESGFLVLVLLLKLVLELVLVLVLKLVLVLVLLLYCFCLPPRSLVFSA